MKHLLFLLLLLSGISTLHAQENGIDQSSDILTVPTGEKFFRWYGYAGRSYFVQVSDASDPLGKWLWAPVIESGNDGEISYEVGGTADKGFYRLKYTDQYPGYGESLESADFDNDGIPNLDEISPPLPFSALSATDPLNADTDGDGMTDGTERTNESDPSNPDENSNSIPDGSDDDDADGTTNAVETTLGSNPKTKSPTDHAIQTFAKKKFTVIPLATPPATGVSRYYVNTITDAGDICYGQYFHPSGNPDDYNNVAVTQHLWRNGLVTAAPAIPPERGGYYAYSQTLPDPGPSDQFAARTRINIANVSQAGLTIFDQPSFGDVVDAQYQAWSDATGWSVNPVHDRSFLSGSGCNAAFLEDGTAYAAVRQSRIYEKDYLSGSGQPRVSRTYGLAVTQWYYWGLSGSVPQFVSGAATLSDFNPNQEDNTISGVGGHGEDGFCIIKELKVNETGDWITTGITLRGKNGAVTNLAIRGFDLLNGDMGTSRNGHVAQRKYGGGIVHQYPGGGTEALSSTFRRNGAGYIIQVNDYGDILTSDQLPSSTAGPDILARKFTDPASGKTSRAICRLTDSSIRAGWTGLDIHALANTMPLSAQQLLGAGYPPSPDQAPFPLLGGTAFKDGKQYPVLLVQVDIEEVISDQFAGIEVNNLPSPFFGGVPTSPDPTNPCAGGTGYGNNPMLMGTRSDGKAHLKTRVNIGGLSANYIPDNLLVGIRVVNDKRIPLEAETRIAVKPRPYPEQTDIVFTPLAQASDELPLYETVFGWDESGDGKLQGSEVAGNFQKTPLIDRQGTASTDYIELADLILIASSDHVNYCVDEIDGILWWTVNMKYAERMITSFITGDKTNVTSDTHVTETTGTVTANEPSDLSHPVGLNFDSSGTATTHQFNYDKDSDLSEDAYGSVAIKDFVMKLAIAKQQDIINAAPVNPGESAYLLMEIPTGSSVCFPGDYSAYGIQPQSSESRLFFSLKKAAISGAVLLKISRYYNDASQTTQRLEISWDEIDANLDDVYDFAYSAADLPRQGAIIQAGFTGTGTRGKPFRNHAVLKYNPDPLRILIINL